MKVQIRFIDGEVMDGESDSIVATRMGFPVSFPGGTATNNEMAWISMGAIKYVKFVGSSFDQGLESDPRERQGLVKVVLRFVDGEVIRTYKDDTFSQEGEGFHLRVWDGEANGIYRLLVSLHALKGIFFVREWDSRSDEERQTYNPPPSGFTP